MSEQFLLDIQNHGLFKTCQVKLLEKTEELLGQRDPNKKKECYAQIV